MARTTVPEATVHENRYSVARKHNVRAWRSTFDWDWVVNAEAETSSVEL
jgi:hypothetical protein